MDEVDCFQAGIVKGLIENNDATRHFGSLLSFQHHLHKAIDLGLVRLTRSGKRKPTVLAKSWYVHADMKSLKDCRALYWNTVATPIDWAQTFNQVRGI